MTAYRLMSTHHNLDGSVEPPSVTVAITAPDDGEALAIARHTAPAFFADDADFAWVVDDTGRVVGSFAVAYRRAA